MAYLVAGSVSATYKRAVGSGLRGAQTFSRFFYTPDGVGAGTNYETFQTPWTFYTFPSPLKAQAPTTGQLWPRGTDLVITESQNVTVNQTIVDASADGGSP